LDPASSRLPTKSAIHRSNFFATPLHLSRSAFRTGISFQTTASCSLGPAERSQPAPSPLTPWQRTDQLCETSPRGIADISGEWLDRCHPLQLWSRPSPTWCICQLQLLRPLVPYHPSIPFACNISQLQAHFPDGVPSGAAVAGSLSLWRYSTSSETRADESPFTSQLRSITSLPSRESSRGASRKHLHPLISPSIGIL
jgi:hypothetical protein